MKSGSITSENIIVVLVNLVPLLIFYLKHQIDKNKSNKKILELEERKWNPKVRGGK